MIATDGLQRQRAVQWSAESLPFQYGTITGIRIECAKSHSPVQQTNVILNLKVINIYQLKSIIELDWSLVSAECNLGVLSRCPLSLIASHLRCSCNTKGEGISYLGIGRKGQTPQWKIQIEIHSTSSTYCISIFVFIFISIIRFGGRDAFAIAMRWWWLQQNEIRNLI